MQVEILRADAAFYVFVGLYATTVSLLTSIVGDGRKMLPLSFYTGALQLLPVVILFGSVLLGWHYALDGYFSIIATISIWKIVGLVVSTSHPAHEQLPRLRVAHRLPVPSFAWHGNPAVRELTEARMRSCED